MEKVCVVGLGYIGLPTAVILAESGFKVIGIDINEEIVNSVNKSKTLFKEPSLDKKLERVINARLLIAQNKPTYADIFLISVPTPHKIGNNGIYFADTTFLFNAIKSICPYLKKGNLIIVESTSPVGTTEEISTFIKQNTSIDQNDLLISFCPERVLPGNIIKELELNDRVIGGLNKESSKKAKQFYSSFCKGNLYTTNARTAELVKLSENAFRDVNIAFANELSMVCERFGIETKDLIELSNHHPRVNILRPSCGVGGHCIAIDPWFIASQAPDITPLIQTARNVNISKTNWVIKKIESIAKEFKYENDRSPVLGLLGLTFKPDVDDIRESPALAIIQNLLDKKYDLLVSEPNIQKFKGIKLYDHSDVIESSDLVFKLVKHKEFKDIKSNNKNIYDFS